jgi:hypothetical protein
MRKLIVIMVVSFLCIGMLAFGTPKQKAYAGETGDNFNQASTNLFGGWTNVFTRPISGLANDNRSNLKKAAYVLPELVIVGPIEAGLRHIGGFIDFFSPGKKSGNIVPNKAWGKPLFNN